MTVIIFVDGHNRTEYVDILCIDIVVCQCTIVCLK